MPRRAELHKSQKSPWPVRLDWLAFGLLLAIVLARCTMQERLREPFQITPQSEATPRTPGPATSVGLDLLCCVPALLVLLRRCIDRTFVLSLPRSLIPLALLDVWMLCSTMWASDRFAALVTACHWTAAGVILWVAIQLSRDWLKIRLIAAGLVGLLCVLIISGLEFRFVEWPTTLQTFEKNKDEMLKGADMQPGTYEAIQFEKKLKLGELFGFFDSPNTLGAVVSLLLVLTISQLLQVFSERAKRPWTTVTLVVMLLGGLIILGLTRSRGAMTTLGLAGIALLLLARYKSQLAEHSRRGYWIGMALVLLGFAAVIGHGLYHHRLPTSTLTFRWQYWIGSMGVFLQHPIHGVGWSNFGLNYLAHRLAQAPEEIKDPHNFLVRFFTELGFIGGALVIVWLALLWWELTRPITPTPPASVGPGVINFMASVAGVAIAIWLVAGVDWAREPAETYLLRLLFLGAMIVVSSLTALRSIHSQESDPSPAPWILLAMLLGVGGMFLHNLIDFSMFEIGPMMLLFLLIGAVLGARQPPLEGERRGGRAALIAACLIWLAGLVGFWIPLVNAEQNASEADEDVRTEHFAAAMQLYLQANQAMHGLNSDYIYRAAVVSPQGVSAERLREAIKANPQNSVYYFDAARADVRLGAPDAALVRRDYEAGLALDPNNVAARLEFADTLDKLGDPAEAARQYQLALDFNSRLNSDENKRLTPEQLKEIQKKLRSLPKH
jgi:O-antigen ligase